MALTESKTAACVIARAREATTGLTLACPTAFSASWFHSMTTSPDSRHRSSSDSRRSRVCFRSTMMNSPPVCGRMEITQISARRPGAGAVPGRWGARLAVRTPPAAFVPNHFRPGGPGRSLLLAVELTRVVPVDVLELGRPRRRVRRAVAEPVAVQLENGPGDLPLGRSVLHEQVGGHERRPDLDDPHRAPNRPPGRRPGRPPAAVDLHPHPVRRLPGAGPLRQLPLAGPRRDRADDPLGPGPDLRVGTGRGGGPQGPHGRLADGLQLPPGRLAGRVLVVPELPDQAGHPVRVGAGGRRRGQEDDADGTTAHVTHSEG